MLATTETRILSSSTFPRSLPSATPPAFTTASPTAATIRHNALPAKPNNPTTILLTSHLRTPPRSRTNAQRRSTPRSCGQGISNIGRTAANGGGDDEESGRGSKGGREEREGGGMGMQAEMIRLEDGAGSWSLRMMKILRLHRFLMRSKS